MSVEEHLGACPAEKARQWHRGCSRGRAHSSLAGVRLRDWTGTPVGSWPHTPALSGAPVAGGPTSGTDLGEPSCGRNLAGSRLESAAQPTQSSPECASEATRRSIWAAPAEASAPISGGWHGSQDLSIGCGRLTASLRGRQIATLIKTAFSFYKYKQKQPR